MDRPLIQKQINELEQLVEKSIKIKNLKVLKNVFEELEIRKSLKKRNTALKDRVENIINEYNSSNKLYISESIKRINDAADRIKNSNFSETLKYWRAYSERIQQKKEKQETITELWNIIYKKWKKEEQIFFKLSSKECKELEIPDLNPENTGLLRIFGYSTSKNKELRRIILRELVNIELPKIEGYEKWGDPKSIKRKNQIQMTLSGLKIPHNKQENYEGAIKVWDEDNKWFLDKIFDD